ncbi:MAG: polysaccharide deacetylase family protein [Aquificae bacterium]|nr:polysaccharide deacetylase family protein [Aquificota bacterium]
MEFLKKNHYNVVSLKKLLQYLKTGKIPPKTVIITIDDGYKSTMKAYRILKNYNFPFTVFLYMEAIAKYPDFLTKEQIQILKSYKKIEFGNHSYAHKRFAKIPKNTDIKIYKQNLLQDIKKAEEKFKALIGYKPKYFAYPYGEYNEIFVEAVKETSYKIALTQDPYNVGIFTNLYLTPRQPIVGKWSTMTHFKRILETEPLNITPINPKFGYLKKNPPGQFKGILKNPTNYENCKLYVSELGWINLKKEGNFLISPNLPYLKRWKNRIGVKCKNIKTKKDATYFYMILKKEKNH